MAATTSSIPRGRCPAEKRKSAIQDPQGLLSTAGGVVRKFVYIVVKEMALSLSLSLSGLAAMCRLCIDLLDQSSLLPDLSAEADLATGGTTAPWGKAYPISPWSPVEVRVP